MANDPNSDEGEDPKAVEESSGEDAATARPAPESEKQPPRQTPPPRRRMGFGLMSLLSLSAALLPDMPPDLDGRKKRPDDDKK